MVGKKLHELINELSTSERKLLLYKAKRSGDKRFKNFVLLLGTKNKSVAEFQKLLSEIRQNINHTSKNQAEKSTALRRFIDFCIKEIEYLKIEAYTRSNSVIRNYILTHVYNKIKTKEIYEDYLDKLNISTLEQKDYWLRNFYLNKAATLKLISQTDKGFSEWRKVISEQINLLQTFHQKELTQIYLSVSSSYVDDKDSIQYFTHT